jgi:hypothetical protein
MTPIVTAAVARRSTERRPAPGDRPDQRPGWTQQVGTLLRRQVALLRSDRRHLALLLLQGPLLGLLLWLVLKADSLALVPGTTANTPASETVAMFVALSATWLGASNAVREIVKERHILRREVDAGLAPSAYVAAKAIVLGALTMLQTTILASIACSAQHPPTGGALGSGRLELAVAGALVGLAATALGLLLSATVTSPDKALALLPMTLVTELALAGGWAASLTTPGLEVLRDLTGARWGVEAIGATVAEDRATWLHASIILLGLTAGALVVTAALVHRHTRPALARRSAVAHLEGLRVLAQQRGSALVGAASFGLLAVALALTADGGATRRRVRGPGARGPRGHRAAHHGRPGHGPGGAGDHGAAHPHHGRPDDDRAPGADHHHDRGADHHHDRATDHDDDRGPEQRQLHQLRALVVVVGVLQLVVPA